MCQMSIHTIFQLDFNHMFSDIGKASHGSDEMKNNISCIQGKHQTYSKIYI